MRKERNADIKKELSNLLAKINDAISIFHNLFETWVFVCGVFTKLRFG